MGLDPLAAGDPNDQLRVGAAGQRRVQVRRAGTAEAGVDVGDAQPDLLVTKCLNGARTATAECLDRAATQVARLIGAEAATGPWNENSLPRSVVQPHGSAK
jgi:hypothetical protein